MKIIKLKSFIALSLLVIISLTGCASNGEKSEEELGYATDSMETFAMDTVMNITVYAKEKANATAMLNKARTTIKECEELFSTNINVSEVSKLNNGSKKSLRVSKKTYDCIKKSIEVSEMTDGLFDITIFPVVKAWGFTTERYRVPSNDELSFLRKNVNYRNIKLKDGYTVFKKGGTEIDLGGIAKGYLSDYLAADFKKSDGFIAAVINLGGNVKTIGKKPDGTPFKVGITDPANPEGVFGVLETGETSVITSGAYQRNFKMDGEFYHHIMDVNTLSPAKSDLSSVTVISEDAALADGLTTALFVMGSEKAMKFDDEHDEIECLLIDNNNKVIRQPDESKYKFTLGQGN